MKPIDLFGAPVNLGAGVQGCSMGPTALRLAGVVERLTALNLQVIDNGDLSSSPVEGANIEGNAKHLADITGWTRSLSASASASLNAGNIPVFLGGDHALSMGTVSGAASYAEKLGKPLFVLWLDAHADYNTPYTTQTGNMHGMPVAFFTGKQGFDGILPNERALVNPSNVFILGVRSIDRDERKALGEAGINVHDMRVVDENGVGPLLRSIVETVRNADGLLHLSLDADFIDPQIAPGVGTAVSGGVTYREAHLAMEILADCGLVTSLDVVELNPYLDERGKTAVLLAELIASLFGQRIFETVDSGKFSRQTDGQAAGRMLLSAD